MAPLFYGDEMTLGNIFMQKYGWSRYGEGYEVTTRGDKRFSALVARLKCGRTIEEIYQCDIKGFHNIHEGKGRNPINKMTREEQFVKFFELYEEWALQNPELMLELKNKADEHGGTLTDMFATTEINQAHVLSILLNQMDGG